MVDRRAGPHPSNGTTSPPRRWPRPRRWRSTVTTPARSRWRRSRSRTTGRAPGWRSSSAVLPTADGWWRRAATVTWRRRWSISRRRERFVSTVSASSVTLSSPAQPPARCRSTVSIFWSAAVNVGSAVMALIAATTVGIGRRWAQVDVTDLGQELAVPVADRLPVVADRRGHVAEVVECLHHGREVGGVDRAERLAVLHSTCRCPLPATRWSWGPSWPCRSPRCIRPRRRARRR